MRKKRKICIITGSRADYGHLRYLIKGLKQDSSVKLQLIVTGMHLSSRYGKTYKVIEGDGFTVDKKINILRYSDSDIGVSKAIGLGCSRFAEAFDELKPDVVVILGDRYEVLSSAIAAYVMKIPIAHIHGGETSQGAIDEAIRHSITKMASIHFAATGFYRNRIIQLGESPKSVFYYGSPGLDAIYDMKLLSKKELSKKLDFNLDGPVAIATYHPVTLERDSPDRHTKSLLKAIDSFSFKTIFTKANADPLGTLINKEIDKFCKKNPSKYKLVDNLGQVNYFSCLKYFDLVLGNSSSGVVEAPSFKIPVVNIGDRQKGRVRAKNVIDVGCSVSDIKAGIKIALSKRFKGALKKAKNPYERYKDGKVSNRIKDKLKNIRINDELIKKSFFDIKFGVDNEFKSRSIKTKS